MSRLSIETPGKAETVIAGLYRDIERRISASPPGLCPVDMSLSFLRLCHAQTCGKCVPCRIGLGQLTTLLEQVLDSTATPETIDLIEKTARVIQDTADCAIGYEAARMVLQGVQGFRDDYLSHVESGRCLFGWDHPVPCVALCPAGVDIPGYIALVRAGRYNDAVRLIRKDNPFPTVCGYVCEHPCEAHCRRSMVDDAVNICGIKRFACDHADNTTPPDSAPSTGKRIGIIGGGQLGRMMALSARYMGFRVGVLDPTPNCPTGQVADFQITAEYDDKTAIHDLAVQSDVLTYEFENVDAGAIDEVRGITATPQGTDLLRVTQHRVREKQFINDHGTATAPWRAVNNFDELDAALGDIHYPAVLKTVSGGYDGHGQLVLRSDADLEKIRSRSDRGGGFPPSILEGFVDFAFEASILVSGNGKDFVTFPIVRNEHRNNILHMTIAPAEVSEHVAREAHELAIRLAKGFELAGTLAIELFITKDDQVIVNELAPRPHNSGHYTIEACSMDQFDAHIRGIAGWPLPKPKLLSPAVMVNVLGQHVEPTRALIATHPEWNVHDYGKAEVRHDRKMGHITVLTGDPAKTVADLEATGCWDDLKKKA